MEVDPSNWPLDGLSLSQALALSGVTDTDHFSGRLELFFNVMCCIEGSLWRTLSVKTNSRSRTVKDLGSVVCIAVGFLVGSAAGLAVDPDVEPLVASAVGVDADFEPGALVEGGEAEPFGGVALPQAVSWEPNSKSATATIPTRYVAFTFGCLPLNRLFKLTCFFNT
jgi:hypothetical protein